MKTEIPLTLLLAAILALPCPASGGATPQPTQPMVDLSSPEYDPADCPPWARETLPAWVQPYLGKNGVDPTWRHLWSGPLAMEVRGIDRYQANHFVNYCPATAQYLYRDYTPLTVVYRKGTLPAYEKMAARYTAGSRSDTEKAISLLTKAMPKLVKHPSFPPRGPTTRPDRNLDDETLLASGCGWCNEQARVFIRLCQVSGIPARMIHLFGQNHTIAEFHADGRWVLADSTAMFVARSRKGELLSVEQCHDGAEGQRDYAIAWDRRYNEIAAMSDEELNLGGPEKARTWREKVKQSIVDELAVRKIAFGVMNYPLPK